MVPERYQEAEQAAQRGDREATYNLLRLALIDDPTYIPAWLWMSRLVDDWARERECLERVLALDPQNLAARDGLEILRLKQMLASTQVPALQEHSPPPRQIGAYLVEQRIITAEQLEQALEDQRRRRKRGEFTQLGDILLQRRCLTPRMLAHGLVMQQQEKLKRKGGNAPQFLGDYLLSEGSITPLQLEAALEEQIQKRMAGKRVALGAILIHKKFLSARDLQRMLDKQRAEFFSRMGD
jgi:hypothetical protein